MKKPNILKTVLLISLFVILVIAILFGFLILKYKNAIERGDMITPQMINSYVANQNLENTNITELEGINEPSMGAKNPVMTIVEFGDFTCARCKAFYPVLRNFVLDNPDKVKLIFRDFPILDTDYSVASIADCADLQGKFWQMHDKLFDYQGSANLTTDIKDQLTLELGLDKTALDNCINNKEYEKGIEKDVLLATKLKLTGTPTNFINGEKVPGVLTEDTLKQFLYKIENAK